MMSKNRRFQVASVGVMLFATIIGPRPAQATPRPKPVDCIHWCCACIDSQTDWCRDPGTGDYSAAAQNTCAEYCGPASQVTSCSDGQCDNGSSLVSCTTG